MMNISSALKGVHTLAFDTPPFIYLIEKHPIYLPLMHSIIARFEANEFHIVASIISLTETLVQPFKVQNSIYEAAYRKMLLDTQGLLTFVVNQPIAEEAGRLRAVYSLRTTDAIHIATAILAGCDAFLTNDKRLKQVSEISILILDELQPDPPTLPAAP